jgi:hypothetical protein
VGRRFGAQVCLSRREWWLFVLLLVCYTYFFPRYDDWNANSRFALIAAIAHERRLQIDSNVARTGDYAEFDGHYYSTKPPVPALLGVPVEVLAESLYRVVTLRLGSPTIAADSWLRMQLAVTWTVIALPAAALGVILFRTLARLGASKRARLIIVLGYGLGSSAFTYAGNFYSHQLSAVLLFACFVLLWRVRPVGRSTLALAGTLLGLALTSEYSTALVVAPLSLYAFGRASPRLAFTWLLAGLVVPLTILGAYNNAILESPLRLGYSFAAQFEQSNNTGFFSLQHPQADALWGITFSPYRGLFFVSPFLLLGLAGFALFARCRARRAEFLVCAWSVLGYFAFNCSSVMWSGGFSVGPRYLVPMLPFITLPMAFTFKRWGRSRTFRLLVAVALAWSLFATWSLTIGTQHLPDDELFPLNEQALPALLAGDVARNWGMALGLRGLWSLVPLLAAVSLILGLLVRSPAAECSTGLPQSMPAGPQKLPVGAADGSTILA